MNPQLREELTHEGIRPEVLPHREVYTAQERAAVCHIPGRFLAKVVVVRDGEWHALAVLPATARLDLVKLRELTGRPGLSLATETEMADLFPDCDVGAMPPVGHLYGLHVYLDRALADQPDIVFEAGTHREEVRIPMREYLRIERPSIVSLAALHETI